MKLVTPNPHPNAVKLYDYLQSIYGKAILSGHQADHFAQEEWHFIKEHTGDYPAIKGLDFMGCNSVSIKNGGDPNLDPDLAIDWWQSGGLVTFCWHWRSPFATDENYHGAFYTQHANLNIEAIMSDPSCEAYAMLIADIDLVAQQLKRLEQAGVAVLWRPLHEAAGGWFWWGACGPEPCIALWKLIFHRLIDVHKLTNLIWVCNCADKAWYPGDAYVDLLGDDIYAQKGDFNPQKARFDTVADFSPSHKPLALSENGVFTDPDRLISEQAHWLWFMTWRDVCTNAVKDGGEEQRMFEKVYAHPYVITRDMLPNHI